MPGFRKLLDQVRFFYQITWRLQSLYALQAKIYRETVFEAERARDPLSLTTHGFTAYSQADEDGMIQELFRRIGPTDRRFIEFGCGDGLENNTVYLLLTGWNGLWMDGSAEGIRNIRAQFAPYVDSGRLQAKQGFLTRDSINGAIHEAGYTGEIDLLSIDVDGNDYWLWEALTVVTPRVVIIEYNATFRPPHKIVQAYDENYRWNFTNYYGASLKALEELGARKGYDLVGCCYAGTNAFFVRRDLTKDLFSRPFTAEHHYREPQHDAFVRGAMRHRKAVGKYQIL